MADTSDASVGYRQLQNLSLGGVAATYKEVQLPKKYRAKKPGEVSSFQGSGIVPVCRTDEGKVYILLQQPQKGKKKGVRWWDFGGRKANKSEFTSSTACRKFAKQTYGLFGLDADWSDPDVQQNMGELFHDLANLPLMLKTGQEWAQTQLLDDSNRVYYNDQHEYHLYLLNVPFLPSEVLDRASEIVDDGKRTFLWLTPEDFMEEALAARLHVDSLMRQITLLNQDTWPREAYYGENGAAPACSQFHAQVA